jgi:hypothetical protein
MPTKTPVDWITNYKINVVNESGSLSILETGISTMYKPEYLQDHINYLQECNPTKQFTLATNAN